MKIYQRAAFFDIDNTVVNIKTMFSFIEFYLDSYEQCEASFNYKSFKEMLNSFPEKEQRKELNRFFYSHFEGWHVVKIRRAAEMWFRHLLSHHNGTLFIKPVLNLIERLKKEGFLIVAVSGSFHEALSPLTKFVGFDCVLATQLIVENGAYTGSIKNSMIGDGKGEAILRFSQQHNVKLRESFACGDHLSDITMLELVGNPRVVAGDPELERLGKGRGWPIISGIATELNDETIHV